MKLDSTNLIYANKRKGMDYKQVLADYITRACECVARDPGRYLPDEVYTGTPGELVIHIPFDGCAYVEANSETYLTT